MKMTLKPLGTFEWSNKPVISKPWVAGAGLFLSALYLGLRILPYFSKHERSIAYVGTRSAGEASSDPEREKMRSVITEHSLSGGSKLLGARGQLDLWGEGARAAGQGYSERRRTSASVSHLVERPLLDGLSTLLQAALVRPWASNEGETTIEAKILGAAASSASQDLDFASVQGGTLIGQAQGNSETRRVEVRFTELISPDGKHHPIGGVALSVDGQSFGIPAHYSSGSAPRILGAAIGEAINAANTLATARILQNTGDDTLILRETQQFVTKAAGQAGSELSQEATKDLKSAHAVLSLEAGTDFVVKLQGASSTRGAP